MFVIKMMRMEHTLSFAAEELKKYLRMMMPQAGEIEITLELGAKDGFRLGLLEDFGIPFEGKDTFLEDVVHIDTDEQGGILAGSNPRSVLFAVYRYLKLNGCRFLFPGFDGEFIPQKDVEPQSYHKMASYKWRGHTLEGYPSPEQLLSYIDYHAKCELNVFGLLNITYHAPYYRHHHNKNRPEETFDLSIADHQWRSRYECEIKKRGLILFSGEHEWIPMALGLNVDERPLYESGEKPIPQEAMDAFALLNGKRGLFKNKLYWTNVCMSRADIRSKIADTIVEAAEKRRHLDFIGFTIADLSKNHCECEECKKKRPSDWYVMILNEIDEKLAAKGLPTRIIFAFYVDCIFVPLEARLNNPNRFMLQYCPISRSYTASLSEKSVLPEPVEFIYNGWTAPKSVEQLFVMFKQWQEIFPGPYCIFEYHFWRPQFRDPGHQDFARRVYEDILALDYMKVNGILEDGSVKSFWPNGFAGHIFAEALFDRNVDFEAEQEDYYSHLYGQDWKKAKRYLEQMTKAFDFGYMLGEKSQDAKRGPHYNPDRYEPLSHVKEYADDMRVLAKEHQLMAIRPQSVSWRVLLRHAEFCQDLAEVMMEKCLGHNRVAVEMGDKLFNEFGEKYDFELEPYFDLYLASYSLKTVIDKMPEVEF